MSENHVLPRQRVLFALSPESPSFLGVPQLLWERAVRRPEAPALLCGERAVSYGELEQRSALLARRLRALGVGPETVVGVFLERSPEALVMLLGILRAGGTYLPLDPACPRERLAWMLADSGAALVLTREELRSMLPGDAPLVLSADGLDGLGGLAGLSEGSLPAGGRIDAADPRGLAYILYTSGSTGRPKGVGVPHAALLHHAQAMARAYRLVPRDRVLQFASLSFDVAAEEIFPSLLAGAAVVLRPPSDSAAGGLDPAGFARLVERERLTVVNLPSPFWHEWVDALAASGERIPACLRLVIVGSDRVAPEKLALWRELVEEHGSLVEWANAYGLTESTITSTLFQLPWRRGSLALSPVPIGQPVAGVRAYVLDAAGEPVPDGMVGELWLGGPALARGYLGRPDLTADRFRPAPADDLAALDGTGSGARLLRTGDLVRARPDGHLELLGRADAQIKIRGFRLEPGEIESALCAHEAVRQAVVLARDTPAIAAGDRRLVAYLVLASGQPAPPSRLVRELRELLGRTLPEPMVPSSFVFLDALPVTAHGKIDRLALARIEPGPVDTGELFVEARTPAEEELARLWSALLGVDRVGVHDDFFHLGGHSLLATRLASRVREAFGVELPVREVFEAPTVAGLAARLMDLRAELRGEAAPRLVAEARGRRGLPLSFSQQRLWVLDRLQPGSALYNLPVFLRFRDTAGSPLQPLRTSALAAALDEVVRRHEALRTVFAAAGGEPVQGIEPHRALGVRRLPWIDLAALPAAARAAEAARLAEEETARPFDLARGPLLRATLLDLGSGESLLLLGMHHIVSDGWSVGVLAGELAALYRDFAAGGPSSLPELTVQYADFAAWQRRWLTGDVLGSQLAYWRGRLAGLPPLDLPTDRPRPPVSTFRGAVERLEVPAGLLAALQQVSRQRGATLFMTLLAAFQALLGRYAGQADFGVGTPVANRNRAEVEGLIGFFVNTLVLRADLAGRPGFAELLERVRESSLAAYAHQDLPFERLVEELAPERSLARNPLFQAAFALQNVPMPELDFGPGLEVREEPHPVTSSKFDLSLFVTESGGRLAADLEHSTDLFEAATAARLLAHYRTLLEAVAADPATPLDEVPLLGPAERAELLEGRNRTRREFPREVPVHRLFEEQARRSPEAVAVISAMAADGESSERLSYRALNRRANRLAHRLRSLGVGPDVPVVVLLERSIEMLVAVLAVLKAGGAYIPLDPRDPAERLSLVLDDVQASVVIGRSGEIVAARLHERGPRALLFVDVNAIEGTLLPSTWEADLRGDVDGENLAYVIYTSGSTGRPKGVAVPHRAVNRLVVGTDYVQIGPDDRVGHLSNPAFDAAIFEVWGALLNGAALVVVPREVALSPAALAAALRDGGVTALFLTTALFNQMAREVPGAFAGVHHLMFGGEAVDPAWVRAVLAHEPPRRLLHVYGPTESTTFTTWHEVREVAEAGTVPIGSPLANTRVYVLDRWSAPVPSGVRGELCIGADGLARGYWNRPDLTAERFVPDPGGEPGARMYRSGDLVRQRRDGAVEFVGRIDHQVKLRGFRIEPGEIEAALMAHPGVAGALVMAREDVPGDRRLVAYVVPQGEPAPEAGELRGWLGERLPHYMIPSRFLFLDELPLSSNGKVDRRALPAPDLSRPDLAADYVAPRTPLERQVAEAWAEVLGVDRVGVHDSFWELGGHSLLATKVLSRLYDGLGVDLPLQALFEAPTLAGFAATLAHGVLAASGEEGERLLEELAGMSEEEVRDLLGEDW